MCLSESNEDKERVRELDDELRCFTALCSDFNRFVLPEDMT